MILPKTQQEDQQEVFDYYVRVLGYYHKVEKKEAEKRVKLMLDSGELDKFVPGEVGYRMVTDKYLSNETSVILKQ